MTKAFVHGNPETAVVWEPLVAALAARGVDDVRLLSPPGFGSPTPDGWDPTPDRYAAWLAAEVEALDQPVDLVGHDWGAGHVYGLVASRPELVRSWAADCAGLLHPDYVWHDLAQVWQQPGAGEEWVDQFVGSPVEQRAAVFESFGLAAGAARSMAEACTRDMGRCILGLYRGAAQPAMAELGQRLAGVERPPGLVIDATDDPYVPSSLGRSVADRLGAAVLTLEGRGHWWMVEAPDRAAEGLIAFWDGL